MNKKIVIGSILAVVLLTLVSFSSVVGYSNVKSNPDNTIITDEYDNPTPIQLVFQLIAKLRNHKDIQNAETEEDLLRIIEEDEELNSIVEQLSVEECGCDEDSPLGDSYSILCFLLIPFLMFAMVAYFMGGITFWAEILGPIGLRLNCWWI